MIKLSGSPTPKQQEFFEKLSALFKEYGAELYGCGCCGSPTISADNGCYDRVNIQANGDVDVD